MAVTALTATTQAAAINYSYTTSGSSDWSSVSNSTYFYDLVDRLPRYKNSGGTVLEVFSSGGATVPQANIIYIDATNGADNGDSGRGNIDKPYASVEYVLSSVTNSGGFTAITSSGSAVITGTTDVSSVQSGQFITGNGIPYNSVVLSKTGSTITISTTATASSSGASLTWWTPKLLRLNGDFTATSNWFRQGFYFDSNPSVIVKWGAFSLYEVTALSVIPYINNGEFNYYGTTSTSKWFYNVANVQTSDTTMSFKFTSIHSNTTSYVLTLGTSPYYYGNYRFSGKILNAKLGYACGIGWSFQNVYFDIDYTYGLLGGVLYDYFQGSGYWNGSITTPASVYAISDGGNGGSNMVFSNGTITGSVSFNGKGGGATRVPFYSNIVGSTTCNLKGMVMYGNIPDAAILNGNVDLYGQHTSYLYCDAGYNRIYRVPTWGIVSRNSAVVEVNADMTPYNITLQNTSKMILNAKVTPGNASIAAGSKLIVNGELNTTSIALNGEMVNNADIILTSGSITISSTGTLRNYKKIESTVTGTTVPTIIKDGGDLYLYPGSYLKVANARGPLRCSSSASTSTNIYNFHTITNCNGSSYGLLVPFSASTSYAANDLAGGLLYENTNY
jgi:hypothetical protein